MIPTLVHRYSWPIREAIEQLLGDAVGDCDVWRIRVEGEELVIDVVAPAGRVTVEEAPSIEMPEAEASQPLIKSPKPDMAPAEPPRKGGQLAQRAGIICAERGFWRFVAEKHAVQIDSADSAATWLRKDCGIDSRADLDHIPDAANVFRDTEKAYRLWLEGYD